jgi:hypothetical protein
LKGTLESTQARKYVYFANSDDIKEVFVHATTKSAGLQLFGSMNPTLNQTTYYWNAMISDYV